MSTTPAPLMFGQIPLSEALKALTAFADLMLKYDIGPNNQEGLVEWFEQRGAIVQLMECERQSEVDAYIKNSEYLFRKVRTLQSLLKAMADKGHERSAENLVATFRKMGLWNIGRVTSEKAHEIRAEECIGNGFPRAQRKPNRPTPNPRPKFRGWGPGPFSVVQPTLPF